MCLAGGAVAYKSKVQVTVAASLTAAEFLAAITAAKIAKYLQGVLTGLGFAQTAATVLYEDNEADIAMVNENKPTPRACHVDIRHFALQEWRERGIIRLGHIPAGVINPADGGTKPLGWTLHSHHARRVMGHYGHPSVTR
jgi:hypothetical protein